VLYAAAPAAAPTGAPAAEEPKAEEKTEFDVKLAGFDAAAKIKVIKEVRVITSLGLKEAKELVRICPLQYCNCNGL
jgi:large subunit ribosomal protein L7/L12